MINIKLTIKTIKKKWLLLLMVFLLAVMAYFLLSSLVHTVSNKQEVLVGEGKFLAYWKQYELKAIGN